jgi:hypothetical protein
MDEFAHDGGCDSILAVVPDEIHTDQPEGPCGRSLPASARKRENGGASFLSNGDEE